MAKKNLKRKINSRQISLVIMLCILAVYSIFHLVDLQKIIYPYPHRIIIEKYASQYGVDPLLVLAVIREESKFLPQSESHKGAVGLMQLMPSTAQSIAQSVGDKGYSNEYLLDPEKNIQYGTWYLASLQKLFSNNQTLVIAAYNGGRGHVQEWIESGQIDPNNIRQEDIPFKETRDYVQRVLKSYQKYIKLYHT
ncbi:lytic transglycosylase domain-containing protein [Desulfosporosinus meridiei]|uniref:Soluble lytic murein transglycosylase-like protein n=1 Tax=Desulfosporosinus meridiei (strain ATCC BAA-275 / DSM 13257 / KCTC 12902 / NCIMB 13706 / S10) TaxID=768704 RepID=J7IX38_DESMD|nr:lytic transglycosylase domain-containing protein [Desulfosporosinus meridiei]AFQ44729.1 soluble lytic murein transglycosylase-like protein [Desulfosporosinus meridiei DSM 13257]